VIIISMYRERFLFIDHVQRSLQVFFSQTDKGFKGSFFPLAPKRNDKTRFLLSLGSTFRDHTMPHFFFCSDSSKPAAHPFDVAQP
jgi:hypothetical protein